MKIKELIFEQNNIKKPEVDKVLKTWVYDDARQYAEKLVKTFGPPDEMSDSALYWNGISVFDQTYIFDESVPHKFPAPHRDFVYSTMTHTLSPELVEIFAYVTGSIIYDGLKNQVTARCGTLYANATTLGFVEDCAAGVIKQEKEAAKKEYARRITKGIIPDWYENKLKE